MESIEQTSSTPKRKYSPDASQIYSNELEEESSKKFFSSHSMTNNPYPSQKFTLGNYQQTTKIIQEFNIQQSTHHSDITFSSTINIKSTGKSSHSGDLLSEADFQRVVQDITPADRDLFDEFLNGIKQRTDDYLFLSSLDDLPSQTHPAQLTSAPPVPPPQPQRYPTHPRGSNTIHYSPHPLPMHSSHPIPSSPAAQTLKQMAVQHQQRLNHPQADQYQSNYYTSYPSTENQYYSSSSSSLNGSDLTSTIDSNGYHYYPPHPPVGPSSMGYSTAPSHIYPSSYPNPSFYSSAPSINTHPNSLHISDDYLP